MASNGKKATDSDFTDKQFDRLLKLFEHANTALCKGDASKTMLYADDIAAICHEAILNPAWKEK